WIQVSAGNSPVHSFYYNKDQLAHQDQRFRNRTSLFKDQISGGNASLQLTGLQVQDQGRYKCYTSSNRGNNDSYINLKVEAPVGKVDLQQVGNRITCSSERIYPEPELTWSTSPPSTVTFKNQAEVQETEQLLYNIRSSLTVSDSDSDLSYSCSIS
ncbi:V-set domain-containing T-cell activation inhibitor 1-like, partial [Seriola lalandi dorsalis]|uniref:V-set domain-containing T-cell activation inhibitor 1-like n=1 Tax=Seriola lalandi dorsalis TaxID=1841481 RepID=UPI000C6F9108